MECTRSKLDKIVDSTKQELINKKPLFSLENKRGIVNADELIEGVWNKFGEQLKKLGTAQLVNADDGSIRRIYTECIVRGGQGDEYVQFMLGKVYTPQKYVRALHIEVRNSCKVDHLEIVKKDIPRLNEIVSAYVKMFKSFIAVSKEDAKVALANRNKADKIVLALLPDAKMENRWSGDKSPIYKYHTNHFWLSVNVDTKEVRLKLNDVDCCYTTPETAKRIIALHSKIIALVDEEKARVAAEDQARRAKEEAAKKKATVVQ